MSDIVCVKFQNKFNPGEFTGREYNYLTAIGLNLGDIVIVPTQKGDGIAQVVRIQVPESQVDERVMPLLKTITQKYEMEEPADE